MSSQIAFILFPPQKTLYYINQFFFFTFITAKANLWSYIECCTKQIRTGKKSKQQITEGLGRSSSAHSKGSARSGHSCKVINDVHLSKQDRGKFASEGHSKWTGTQPKGVSKSQKSITANANASAQGRWPKARLSVCVNSFFEKTAIGCRLQQSIG